MMRLRLMRELSAKFYLLRFVFVTLLWTSAAFAAGPRCLPYGEQTVSIRGTIRLASKFGPPNYGESPKTDAKVRVPMLQLATPVTVCPSGDDEFSSQTYRDVKVIQLILFGRLDPALIGRHVLVTGQLGEAESARHYTAIIMDVSQIKEERALNDKI